MRGRHVYGGEWRRRPDYPKGQVERTRWFQEGVRVSNPDSTVCIGWRCTGIPTKLISTGRYHKYAVCDKHVSNAIVVANIEKGHIA